MGEVHVGPWDATARIRRDELRTIAHHIPCPDCKADAGQPCINSQNGEPVQHFPAHLHRLIESGATEGI